MSRIRLLVAGIVAVALCASGAEAQRRISGTVTAQGTSEPLSSASVQVIGTTLGTFTNEAGRFSIQVPDGTQQLRVRRIGYRARIVPVPAAQTGDLAINLEKEALQLETQVVTGAATSVSSANAANAVTQLNTDQIVGRAPAQTVDNALQGKVAGANISTNSGAPGGGSQVQIRGVTSINASTAPLYVVDGVIVNNSAIGNGLNSLTQAGGGISNSQDQQVNRIADLNPEEIESIEVLKGPAAGAIYGSKGSNGVIVIRTKHGTTGAPQFNTRLAIGDYSAQQNRLIPTRCFHSAQEVADYLGITAADAASQFGQTPACHDFQKEYYKADGPSYQTSLDIRGGSAGGTTYYIGGLAQRDNAIQPGTYYQKQSLTGNIGQTLGPRVTLQFNNNFIHTLADRGISGNDNSPIVSPVDVFSSTPSFFDLGHRVSGAYPVDPFISSGTNPWQTSELVKMPQDVFRYIGDANATLNVVSSERQTFDINAVGGVDVTDQQNKIFSPPAAYFEPADGFPGTIVNTSYNAQYANGSVSGVHRFTTQPFTATTSFGLRRDYRHNDLVFNQGKTIPPNTTNFTLAANQSQAESRSEVRDLTYYAQEEFLTLNERLLLTAAINTERSSVNGDPSKFYSYPKFSASYRVPLFPSFFNEFKLRAAYGKAGNQPLYGYSFTGLPVGLYSGQLGLGISTVAGNPNIRPEISSEFESGADLAFFGGRLSLEGTFFSDKIKDLILQYAPAPSTGYTTEFLNRGSMQKSGTELQLNAVPVQTKSFTWNTGVSFSTVNSRVSSLGGLPCFNVGFFGFGDPYVCNGLSVTTIRVPNGGATKDGYTYLESLPRSITGWSNDFTFGVFRASGLLDYRYGGYVDDLTLNYFDGSGLYADTTASNTRNAAANNGDLRPYAERATFVKLRELNLSVGLPQSLTSRISTRAKDVRLELAGRNLYTWTKYKGYDPEVSNFSNVNLGRGQDVTPYPPARSYFLAIVAGF